MPLQQGVRLHNSKRLFPLLGCPGKQIQKDSIRSGTRWALYLPAKYDELLTQERIFCDELSLGTSKIGEHST